MRRPYVFYEKFVCFVKKVYLCTCFSLIKVYITNNYSPIKMYRTAINKLNEWKLDKKRKPLIIQGARQVGKTWLMQEFGKTAFKKVVYINFEQEVELRNLFEKDLQIPRIITTLEAYTKVSITPNDSVKNTNLKKPFVHL